MSYLALQGCYDIQCGNVFNLLSATYTQQGTHRAHPLHLWMTQDEPCIHTVSQQVYHSGITHIHGVYNCIGLTWLRDVSKDFRIANFGQLFHMQIPGDRGLKDSGLILRYDQNILIDSIFTKFQNGLLYYCQPFHNPTHVKHLELDCNIDYTNANQGIMPDAHNIWVLYMNSEENYLDNTFEGRIFTFPWIYFNSTPLNQIIQYDEPLPPRKAISTASRRCKKTQQWVLCPQAQEYDVMIPTNYEDLYVGLIGLTGSSGLSNRWTGCILYQLEQLLDRHIWCRRLLQ